MLKRTTGKLLLALISLAFVLPVNAGGNVSSEWGLTAGVRFNGRRVWNAPEGLSLTPAISYNVGLHASIGGAGVAVQPELNYGYTATKIRSGNNTLATVKAHDLEVPVLASLRFLPVVRFNVGPVFNIMSSATYDSAGGDKTMFGGMVPTFGYIAGISVVPTRHLLIDLRFTGYIQRTSNQFEGKDFTTKPCSAGLKIGYLF